MELRLRNDVLAQLMARGCVNRVDDPTVFPTPHGKVSFQVPLSYLDAFFEEDYEQAVLQIVSEMNYPQGPPGPPRMEGFDGQWTIVAIDVERVTTLDKYGYAVIAYFYYL